MKYKSNEEIKKEFDEVNWTPFDKLSGSRFLSEEAMLEFIFSIRLQDLQAVKELVEGMVVNTPDEVAELNKGLPNPLAEYAYNNAVGYCKAVEDIKVKLDELMKD